METAESAVMVPNSPNILSKALRRYRISESVILRKGQGQGQGHKRSLHVKVTFSGVTHVLWAILHVECNNDISFSV